MSGTNHATVSISRAAYDQIAAAAKARGITIAELVRQALDGQLVEVDAPAVPVSAEVYRSVGKVARREGLPMSDVLDAAITKLLDDAARWCEAPGRSKRAPRTPRVDHAYRGAR